MNFSETDLNKQHKRKHNRKQQEETEINNNSQTHKSINEICEKNDDVEETILSSSLDDLIIKNVDNDANIYDKGFININNDDGGIGYPSSISSIGKTKKLPLNRNIRDNMIIDTNTNQQNANNVLTKCAIKSKDNEGMEQFLQTKYGVYSETFNAKNDVDRTDNIEKFNNNNNSAKMVFDDNKQEIITNNEERTINDNNKPRPQKGKQHGSIKFETINKQEDDDIIEPDPIRQKQIKYKKCFRICYIVNVIALLIVFMLLLLFKKINKFALENYQIIRAHDTTNDNKEILTQENKELAINNNEKITINDNEEIIKEYDEQNDIFASRTTGGNNNITMIGAKNNNTRLRDSHGRFIKKS